jgi:hypothetical protein
MKTSQSQLILECLSDGQVHPVTEITRRCYKMRMPTIARLGARIYDLRKQGHEILTLPWRSNIVSYQLIIKTKWKK